MTNLDYIMQNLTERDVATLIESEMKCLPNPGSLLARRAYLAFERWRNSLSENHTQVFYVDDEHNLQPSVFATSRFYFHAGTSADLKDAGYYGHSEDGVCKFAIPRKDSLSIQVWLSKQYNPNEWR